MGGLGALSTALKVSAGESEMVWKEDLDEEVVVEWIFL